MNIAITLRGVSFELSNGRELFQNLNLSLDVGLTALVGPNGVGKTTLARLISGDIEPTVGTVRRNTAVTFFAQRQEPPAMTVDELLAFDYTWSALSESLLNGIDRQAICSDLSGGQWMRVRLSRTLNDGFLILDEPTNDLDRSGREIVCSFCVSEAVGVY